MTDNKPIAILAVDIETTGSNMVKNAIIAIGYFLGDEHGNEIAKKRITMKYSEDQWEVRCWSTFWVHYQDKLEILKQNAVTPYEGIAEFVKDLYAFEDKYTVHIITDNPSFDISFLNYYIAMYLDSMPLNYTKNSKYRQIYDIDSYSRGVMNIKYNKSHLGDQEVIDKYKINVDKSTHDHLPENDAKYIYNFHMGLLNKL